MKLEIVPLQEHKLRVLRVQLIETHNGVILRRGRTQISIVGAHAAEVVKTMLTATMEDGASRSEVCELFAAPDRPLIESLVRRLEAHRILVPVDSVGAEPQDPESSLEIFYWHFDKQLQQVAASLNDHRLVIIGVNCVARQLAASLIASGMENFEVVDYPLLCNLRLFDDYGQLSPEQWTVTAKLPVEYAAWTKSLESESYDCLVATSDFGGLQLMRQWNEYCLMHNRHFLPVVLQDLIGYVGPLVVPGETACFECLRARQNSHLENPDLARAAESAAFEGQVVAGFHPSMASILGNIAALELSRFYGGWMSPRIIGSLIEVNLLDLQVNVRKVLKVPRCRVCSPLNVRSSVSSDRDVFMPGHPIEE